ncbi:MAG: hypothetical protein ACHQCI_05960 [Solirubrobacterales bacterium]
MPSISSRTSGSRAVLALAAAILAVGLVQLIGEAGAAAKPEAHASKSVAYKQKTFTLAGANAKRRLTVRCPGRLVPLGGGMTSSPLPAADGEGIYPHSYERLGVQHGYHSTVVLFDPSPNSTEARSVTLQVACARKQRHVTPPHKTVYVNPGETKTAVATCPGRRHLFGGGFQRTDFTARGGDYITDSHAISDKSWSVTGRAFGQFGGELTSIAYCWRSKKPLLTEVSASADIGIGRFATATTPPCPAGHHVFGGFSTTPAGSVLMTNGVINGDGSWSASAMNHFGPSASITAYGYCLKL